METETVGTPSSLRIVPCALPPALTPHVAEPTLTKKVSSISLSVSPLTRTVNLPLVWPAGIVTCEDWTWKSRPPSAVPTSTRKKTVTSRALAAERVKGNSKAVVPELPSAADTSPPIEISGSGSSSRMTSVAVC
jgi:hypothetical protein